MFVLSPAMKNLILNVLSQTLYVLNSKQNLINPNIRLYLVMEFFTPTTKTSN